MKIAHLIFALPNAGLENMLVDIANRQSTDNDVTIIILNNLIDLDLLSKFSERILIKRFERRPGTKSFIPVLKFISFVLRNKFDILHFHDSNLSRLLPFSQIKKRSVVTVHNTGLYNKNLNYFSAIYAISNSVLNDIIRDGKGELHDKVKLVYNGINFSGIIKKEEFIINKSIKILQVSRLDIKQKGQDILLKALRILKIKYNYSFSCDFIGVGNDLEFLSKKSAEYNIENEVSFLGNRDRSWIYDNLCNYDLIIQPSLFEGFGLVVVEGLAANIPVIVSNIEGPAEILNYGEFGFMFELGKEEQLVQKIIMVSDLYEQKEIEDFVAKAYKYAVNRFSIENTVEAYIQNYNLILNKENEKKI